MLFLSRFRLTSPPESLVKTQSLVVRRHRVTKSSKKTKANQQLLLNKNTREPTPASSLLDLLQPFRPQQQRLSPYGQPHERHHAHHEQPHQLGYFKPWNVPHATIPQIHAPIFPDVGQSEAIPYFEKHVETWTNAQTTLNRLKSFGFDVKDSQILLQAFAEDVKALRLSSPDNAIFYGLERFKQDQYTGSIDEIYSTVFFTWVAEPTQKQSLEALGVAPFTISLIARMVKTTSRPYPADDFPLARSMRRKIIMHVGPTNSGKTHHALRALAASESGVYAGPLRLLAHEIFERLNAGKIVPLGCEPDPTVDYKAHGNPKYKIACTMITGEERRLVLGARLLACTVEMLPYHQVFDVAVIDEIQLLSDQSRGSGWTHAVLGLCAKELHLCGEDGAVPIVQKLLENTGDEIIVKRYERLTPLVVEEKSLDGNFEQVKKGDCIVSFSRNAIFNLKRKVERETGLKCAVVYGRLPPEVRNEQAALFNNPDSDYDVIIGSDAIGMGLNLKIKRVIFEKMTKFYSPTIGLEVLSISSTKQIAGRAGRYGLHESQVDLGGTVTTLHEDELPLLRATIALPNKPLPYARIEYSSNLLSDILRLLPPGTTFQTAADACKYMGLMPPKFRYTEQSEKESVLGFIDSECKDLSIADKFLIMFAPIPWRDKPMFKKIYKPLLKRHITDLSVKVDHLIENNSLMKFLETLEGLMHNEQSDPENAKKDKKYKRFVNSESLVALESLHKTFVFYLWMNFHKAVVYPDYIAVGELKERAEKVLNWTLNSLSEEGGSKSIYPPFANRKRHTTR